MIDANPMVDYLVKEMLKVNELIEEYNSASELVQHMQEDKLVMYHTGSRRKYLLTDTVVNNLLLDYQNHVQTLCTDFVALCKKVVEEHNKYN